MPEKIKQNAQILHDFCPKKYFLPEFWGGQLPPAPVSYAYESRYIEQGLHIVLE